MARMDWSKKRPYKGQYEEKYDPGTVMPNGRVVSVARPDGLAARAAAAEAEWLAERAKKRSKQRAARRAAKRKPTAGERARMKLIRQQLSLSE